MWSSVNYWTREFGIPNSASLTTLTQRHIQIRGKMASRSLSSQVVQGEAPEENTGLPSGPSSRFGAGGGARANSDARRSQIMGVEADMTFGETSTASSRLQYTSKIITSQAFEVFDELRRRNQLCDVTIKVDGHEHTAHRVVLAAVSPYFRGMFTGTRYFNTYNCSVYR